MKVFVQEICYIGTLVWYINANTHKTPSNGAQHGLRVSKPIRCEFEFMLAAKW